MQDKFLLLNLQAQNKGIITTGIIGNTLNIYIKPIQILKLLEQIKLVNDNRYYISLHTAIDKLNNKARFSLAYLLKNYINLLDIYIQINIGDKTKSCAHIYPSLIWTEREVFDMFGIFFTKVASIKNDLRRIISDYKFRSYPLRKDHPVHGFVEVSFSIKQMRLVRRDAQI